jgi:hypothetical protein
MASPLPLEPGSWYHIFNRGNNGEDLFREERNYEYFLRLYAFHMQPVTQTYAFCLLRNHFHVAIQVRRSTPDINVPQARTHLPPASQAFASFFNAYVKGFNKTYTRTGGLFENPYRRIRIHSRAHLSTVIAYIHRNPQKHGFINDFRDWKWSSYSTLLARTETWLARDEALALFPDTGAFAAAHAVNRGDIVLSEQDFE